MNLFNKALAKIAIFFIKIYQKTLSPDKWFPSFWLKGKVCLHTPHCSQYWIEVLERYWFIPWIFIAMERVGSCHPWNNTSYDPPYYKIVFFSSAPIGQPFLEELVNNKWFEVSWVVTQPDKPAGRWQQIKENPIKQKAKNLWITNIYTPSAINPNKSEEWNKFAEHLELLNPDFLVVVAYWKIIPASILEIPNISPVNIHWSILPKYRGASPIQAVLLNQEEKTWITVMKMTPEMDAWDIIKIQEFSIKFNRTALDIINQIQESWPSFFSRVLWDYGKGLISEKPQDHNKALYCEKISKEDGLITPKTHSLEDIYRKYRAYYLWPKVYFFLQNNKKVIIEELKPDPKNFEENKKLPLIDKNNKLNDSVQEIFLKPEWKKSMSRESFCQWYLDQI